MPARVARPDRTRDSLIDAGQVARSEPYITMATDGQSAHACWVRGEN